MPGLVVLGIIQPLICHVILVNNGDVIQGVNSLKFTVTITLFASGIVRLNGENVSIGGFKELKVPHLILPPHRFSYVFWLGGIRPINQLV